VTCVSSAFVVAAMLIIPTSQRDGTVLAMLVIS
jgi:hypothetical protein